MNKLAIMKKSLLMLLVFIPFIGICQPSITTTIFDNQNVYKCEKYEIEDSAVIDSIYLYKQISFNQKIKIFYDDNKTQLATLITFDTLKNIVSFLHYNRKGNLIKERKIVSFKYSDSKDLCKVPINENVSIKNYHDTILVYSIFVNFPLVDKKLINLSDSSAQIINIVYNPLAEDTHPEWNRDSHYTEILYYIKIITDYYSLSYGLKKRIRIEKVKSELILDNWFFTDFYDDLLFDKNGCIIE